MEKEAISIKELSKTLGISLPIAHKLVKSRDFKYNIEKMHVILKDDSPWKSDFIIYNMS